jgi:hypothetical protein
MSKIRTNNHLYKVAEWTDVIIEKIRASTDGFIRVRLITKTDEFYIYISINSIESIEP